LAWTSSSSKHKSTAAERGALARLEAVRRRREPFLDLSRGLVQSTLERYLPSEGAVIEIGMGDGQLYERLPEALLPRVTHTEPFAAASRAFRKQHPNVNVLQAGAEKLPFEDASAAGVVALCVLDVVRDGPAVVRELARVLRPGGRFIHFLDMSTMLEPVVAALEDSGLVLLPNVFADPSAGEWPEDLFLVPREQLTMVVTILQATGHALARPLSQYLGVFTTSPLAVAKAAAELIQLQEDSGLRSALRGAFRAAFELAPPELRERLAGFQGRSISSAQLFAQRLRGWFGPEAGFQVELASVMRASEHIPKHPSGFAYMSSCVGEQRQLPYAPDSLICPDSAAPGDSETLLELGVFAFVASRI
jgi:SAM-dependent methyltransferase